MTKNLASLRLLGENENLKERIKKYLHEKNIEVVEKSGKETDYRLLIHTISIDESPTQFLDTLEDLKTFPGKSCVLLETDSLTDPSNLEKTLELIQPYLHDRLVNLRLVIAYDLYDQHSPSSVSRFQSWLCSIIADKSVHVSSDGARRFFPTSVTDLGEVVVKSLFIANTLGEKFTAAGEGLSDLDIAYQLKSCLQKQSQSFDINIDDDSHHLKNDPSDQSVQTQAILNWIPQSNFSRDLDEIVKKCSAESVAQIAPPPAATYRPLKKLGPTIITSPPVQKTPVLLNNLKTKLEKLKPHARDEEPKNVHQVEKRSFIKLCLIFVFAVIILTLIPFVVTAGSLYLATVKTAHAYEQIRLGEEKKARSDLAAARFWQGITSSTFPSIVPVANLFSRDTAQSTNNYIIVLSHTQEVIQRVIDTYALSNQLYLSLLGKQTGDSRSIISAVSVNLLDLADKLSQIQLLLAQTKLPFGYGEQIKAGDYNAKINLLKSQITLSLPLLDLLNKVTGNLNKQSYLVLVQDPNELRPTGGFITSYILFTLDQGKIINFQADSSLAIDRLIEGKIEAPALIKQLLGTENWTFHDSNYDADFPTSARQSAWFIERFKSIPIDGVIGLNINFYKYLLDEIGPQQLQGGTTVNSDNLKLLASNPTSDKSLDIVTATTQSLTQKLESADLSFAAFSRAVLKTIAANEIDVWFKDASLESYITTANLSGHPQSAICHPQLSAFGCSPDTIYLNESNFSQAKINAYLHRDDLYNVQVGSDGSVKYVLTYNYSYPVPAPTNLGQVYKAYYQLYLPDQAQQLLISLDGQPVDDKNIIKTLSSGLIKLEFSAALSLNQPHKLQVNFTSANIINLKKSQIPYTLAILKQPGTLDNTLTVSLNFPKTLQPRLMTVPLKQNSPSELLFQASPVSEENIGVLFKNTAL